MIVSIRCENCGLLSHRDLAGRLPVTFFRVRVPVFNAFGQRQFLSQVRCARCIPTGLNIEVSASSM